jgi:hypothetical protein
VLLIIEGIRRAGRASPAPEGTAGVPAAEPPAAQLQMPAAAGVAPAPSRRSADGPLVPVTLDAPTEIDASLRLLRWDDRGLVVENAGPATKTNLRAIVRTGRSTFLRERAELDHLDSGESGVLGDYFPYQWPTAPKSIPAADESNVAADVSWSTNDGRRVHSGWSRVEVTPRSGPLPGPTRAPAAP